MAEPSDTTPDNFIAKRRCDVCGQDIDLTDPDHIFHHGPEPHDPLPLPDR